MSFFDTFDINEEDYSGVFSSHDNKLQLKNSVFSCFNFSSSLANEDDPIGIIKQAVTLNNIMNIIMQCDMDYRAQPELPYLLDKEYPYSGYFDKLLHYTEISFESIPKGVTPEADKNLSKENLKEYINCKPHSNTITSVTDPLGIYESREWIDSDILGEPIVKIDLEKIKNYCSTYAETAYLSAIVLIHELCHALLDPNNYKKYVDVYNHTLPKQMITYDTMYGCWKEEAIANAITYKIVESIGNESLLEVANKFMSNQNGAYYFGYLIARMNKEKEYSTLRDEWISEKLNGSDINTQLFWMEEMIDTIDLSNRVKTNSTLSNNR